MDGALFSAFFGVLRLGFRVLGLVAFGVLALAGAVELALGAVGIRAGVP
jgi:hypothetical protein